MQFLSCTGHISSAPFGPYVACSYHLGQQRWETVFVVTESSVDSTVFLSSRRKFAATCKLISHTSFYNSLVTFEDEVYD